MFWLLLLAHFLADYPLQPDRLVAAKRSWIGQLIHAFVHLVVMLIVVGQVRSQIWPAILLLAFIHLLIDIGKSVLGRYRPDWVVAPYFIDQLLHISSIWLVSQWIARQAPVTLPPDTTQLVIYAIAYLITTIVWYISERMISWNNPEYLEQVRQQSWSRMLTRAVFLSLFLIIFDMLPFQPLFQAGFMIAIPYFSGQYRFRSLLTDLGVALLGFVFIITAL
jgi:hypothetical protein